MVTTRFGKYLIIRELGSGATADVYLAQDTSQSNQEVALKILKSVLVADKTAFLRFQQEASIASQLNHPNIANVLEVGEYAGYFYIAMRYINGEALDKVLKKGVLSWQMAARLAQQIGSALDYAHGLGFIHRDVKPANIMMTPDGDFILTDFGLARAIENSGLTSTGAVLGTPSYIPPEVWNTKAVPASDQYALACVVAEALTGKQAFPGTTLQMVLNNHLITGPELPDVWPVGVPAGVGAVLQRALDKDPSKRFRKCVHFATTLVHASQTPPPPARKAFPKALVGIVIGLMLAAAAIITVLTLQNQSNQEKTQATLTAARANLAFSRTVTASPKSPTLAPTSPTPEPTSTTPPSTSTQSPTPTSTFIPTNTFTPTITKTLIPTPVILFEDNFDNGLASDWVIKSGTYSITDGKLGVLGSEPLQISIGDQTWKNYKVSFKTYNWWCSSTDTNFSLGIRGSSWTHKLLFAQVFSFYYGWAAQDGQNYSEITDTRMNPCYLKSNLIEVNTSGNKIIFDQTSFIVSGYDQGGVYLWMKSNMLIDDFKVVVVP